MSRLVSLGFASSLSLSASVLLFPALVSAFDARVVFADTGEPIANAKVTVLGRTGSALTDADGRCTFSPDPSPPFEVLIFLLGELPMKPILVERLPEEGPLVLRVAPLVHESVTVTVTSGAAPDVEASPASGNTLVSLEEIELRQPDNLAQALENVVGISQVSEGQAAVPAIRGLARGRTLILIDDARVSSERRVGPSATFLDPFSIEGIQVSRGPGAVAYGSDAFGGVIHARTRRALPGSGWGARLLGTVGAGAPQRRLGAELTRGFRAGGLLLQGHYRSFDDYRSPEGEVFNSGASDHGFLARVDKVVSRGLFSTGWQSDFGRDIERPRTDSTATRFFYPVEDSHRFTASYDLGPGLGLHRMSFSTFLGSYRVVTDQDRFATETAPREVERADVDARDFGVRASAEKLFGETRLAFGLDLNGRFDLKAEDVVIDFDLSGDEASRAVDATIESATRTDAGLYVYAEGAAHRKLVLGAGGRVDRVATSNRGGFFGDRSTANAAFSGYVSATVGSFRGTSVTAQAARGFRDPVLSDRYFRGVTGRGFITGNPDLEPETSTQLDLAVRHTAALWRGAFYLYDYRIQDLVERYEEGEDLFFFRNRGGARIRGVEVEAQAELPKAVTVELTLQKQTGRALDDEPLDDIAPLVFTLQVRKAIGGRAFVQLRGAIYGADDAPGPTEVAREGYGLLDLAAGFALTESVEVRFVGRNLFDVTYPVSPDRRAVPAPGISGLLTLLVTL